MPTSPLNFRVRFQELVLSFLWRQWSALGVAGQARNDDEWVIDPEALLLLTTTFARHDPRLFDEVLDWLSQNGGVINLQRLKNLQTSYRFGHPGVLATMASSVGQRAPNLKWKNHAKELTGPGEAAGQAKPTQRKTVAPYTIPTTPEPLFHGIPVIGSPDAAFLEFGWLRDTMHLRGLSTVPNPHLPTNLLFKLRGLFGLQARAEIMTCLLCSDATQPSQIAELTGYFPRTVQLALNEMARSGHVLTVREAREKHFRLRKEEWGFLAKPPEHRFPQWIKWGPLFTALDRVNQKILVTDFASAPFALQAIELRSAVDDVYPALMRSGFDRQFSTSPKLTGGEFVEALMTDFTRIVS